MFIHIYADGASLEEMIELNEHPLVKGFTTNPSLAKKAGVKDYRAFAKSVLNSIKDKPVSFEVLADSHEEMYRQANIIASWASNVFVKIPIINTKNESSIPLIERLVKNNIQLNITAILSMTQIKNTIQVLEDTPNIISVFAGRISDTGNDSCWFIRYAAQSKFPKQKILWASCREAYNIVQAEINGANIITLSKNILDKVSMFGKNLDDLSLETVKQFYKDSIDCGYSL